jgi:hypothetical protein
VAFEIGFFVRDPFLGGSLGRIDALEAVDVQW